MVEQQTSDEYISCKATEFRNVAEACIFAAFLLMVSTVDRSAVPTLSSSTFVVVITV